MRRHDNLDVDSKGANEVCVLCDRANPVPTTNGGPGGAWPVMTGNDFLPNHMANGIDYASIHMWPDNWGRTDKAFGTTWLNAHIADVKYLGKPLVLEEFGKAVGARSLPHRTISYIS